MTHPSAPAEPGTAGLMSGHKGRAVLLLALVYTFNYVDRQILVILQQPIKAEFGLKDWQLGFLTGTAFALFYATLGIPIARLADRWHRVNIIAISLALWSAMTALCAATQNFAQLAAARIGVGIGEAGGSPPAVSLLASYFPQGQRGTAMSIYALGPTIGILLGFVVGGWINDLYGWRAALVVAAVPGLLLALLIKLLLREPERSSDAGGNDVELPFWATVRRLFAIRTFRLLNIGAVATALTLYGVMGFTPVYLMREFGLQTGEVGTAIGLIAGIAGSAGIFVAGSLADRLSRRDPRWLLWIPAVTTLLFLPFVLAALHAPTARLALLFMIPTYAVALAYTGPTWAALQTVAPPRMRAMAAAILLLLVNLVGMGVGPPLIGAISDLQGGGADGLRLAIACVAISTGIASPLYYLASRSLRNDARPADGRTAS